MAQLLVGDRAVVVNIEFLECDVDAVFPEFGHDSSQSGFHGGCAEDLYKFRQADFAIAIAISNGKDSLYFLVSEEDARVLQAILHLLERDGSIMVGVKGSEGNRI